MIEAARANAKASVEKPAAFTPDSADKQAAATAELRRAIETHARPNLESLGRLHPVMKVPGAP